MPSGSSLCPETWMGIEKLVFSLLQEMEGSMPAAGARL